MLGGLFGGIVVAAILSLFCVDELFKGAVKDLLHKEVSTGTYYFVFGIIGMISGIFNL